MPLGAYSLWPATESRSTSEVIHIHRNLSEGLGRISMHQYIMAMRNSGDFPNRLDGAYFVVGVHD